MKKLKIFDKFGATFTKATHFVKSHSPEFLIAGGIVGVLAGTVTACFATVKAGKVIKLAKNSIKDIHKEEATADLVDPKETKKRLTAVYLRTAGKILLLYIPSVALMGLSFAEIVGSNVIQKKRIAAVSAAYLALDKGFKEYRARVVEKFGPETDKELRFGLQEKKITETTVDPETGKEKKETKTVTTTIYDGASEYARFFDSGNPNFTTNADYNRMFLVGAQNYANDKLRADGYLYLNDVYEELGIQKTTAGQVVGWIYDPDNKDIDSYVDFGMRDIYLDSNPELSDKRRHIILLDFNVDGLIVDVAHKEKI